MNTGWGFIELNVQGAANKYIIVRQCCPRLCFTVDRWKETLPQHVKSPSSNNTQRLLLLVKEKDLHKELEFGHPSSKENAVKLISVYVLQVFWSICNFGTWCNVKQKGTDKSE